MQAALWLTHGHQTSQATTQSTPLSQAQEHTTDHPLKQHFYASSPAATPAPTATPLNGLASNTTVEYGIVAIAIIIIVIGAVLAMLVTRKHP